MSSLIIAGCHGNTCNSHFLYALLEFPSWKGFGQRVGYHTLRGRIFEAYSLVFNAFSNEMMLRIDMLCPSMVYGILGECYGRLVILLDRCSVQYAELEFF